MLKIWSVFHRPILVENCFLCKPYVSDDKLGCRRSKSFSLHGCMLIYVNKMSASYDQDTNEIEVQYIERNYTRNLPQSYGIFFFILISYHFFKYQIRFVEFQEWGFCIVVAAGAQYIIENTKSCCHSILYLHIDCLPFQSIQLH